MKWTWSIPFIFGVVQLNAQIEEIHDEPSRARSRNPETSIVKKFKFTSPVNDTITIKIINPRGELMQLASREQPVTAGQVYYFEQESSSVLPGNYQIIVEGKEGRRFTRRIIIDKEISSRKKS